jgi:hypothetical protein
MFDFNVLSDAWNINTDGVKQRVARSLVLSIVFCRSLFDLLAFSFWLLCCLSFDARVLITPFGISKLLLIMTYKSCEEQSVVKHKYKYNFLIMKM